MQISQHILLEQKMIHHRRSILVIRSKLNPHSPKINIEAKVKQRTTSQIGKLRRRHKTYFRSLIIK